MLIRQNILWAAVFLGFGIVSAEDPCLKASTCAECIKIHKDCAWCTDPLFNISARCGNKDELKGRCPPQNVFDAISEIKIPKQQNIPLGRPLPAIETITQLEPQQVSVRIRPGDSIEVPFRYQHRNKEGIEVRNFQIMTSSYNGSGVDVEFFIDCNGNRIKGTSCPGIHEGQKINFYAKITLKDCSRADTAISVSVYSYTTVSAVFVSGVCACECERYRNQERRSPVCRHHGDLVCGACKCAPGKGGRNCECNLHEHGVSTAIELEDRCRPTPGAAVCSGHGNCNCGKCECESSKVNGNFCDCDNTGCPRDDNGQMCSGRGDCMCGKCVCHHGYGGEDCSCSNDPEPCVEDGLICSGNGECECGRCACNTGFTGTTCSMAIDSDDIRPLPNDDSDESEDHDEGDESRRKDENAESDAATGETAANTEADSAATITSIGLLGLVAWLTVVLCIL